MSPELFEKWEHIVDDIDMTTVPVDFIKKIILKLEGRKQKTINVQALLNQGFDGEEVEEAIARKMEEYELSIESVELILNIESIADVVQPETDDPLKNIK